MLYWTIAQSSWLDFKRALARAMLYTRQIRTHVQQRPRKHHSKKRWQNANTQQQQQQRLTKSNAFSHTHIVCFFTQNSNSNRNELSGIHSVPYMFRRKPVLFVASTRCRSIFTQNTSTSTQLERRKWTFIQISTQMVDFQEKFKVEWIIQCESCRTIATHRVAFIQAERDTRFDPFLNSFEAKYLKYLNPIRIDINVVLSVLCVFSTSLSSEHQEEIAFALTLA